MTTRAAIVAEASARLGDRWMHQAALKGVACDCYGLITVVGLALGIKEAAQWANDPAIKGYARSPDARVFNAACQKYLDPIQIALAGLGDILALRWATEPQHLAIISKLDPTYIIHSYAAARKVSENNIAGEWQIGVTWRSLIVSAWRYRGVED